MWVEPYSEVRLLATAPQSGNLAYAFSYWDCNSQVGNDDVFGWNGALEDEDEPRYLTMHMVKPVLDLEAVFVRRGTRDSVLADPPAIASAPVPVDPGAPAPDAERIDPNNPDNPPEPEPEVVQPKDIAFSSIEYDAEAGVYLLTITSGVKFCKYTLYESDTPTANFTKKAEMAAPYSANPYTAETNGPVLFTVPKGVGTKFWGVKAEEGTVTQ